jgi:hypothetical protein
MLPYEILLTIISYISHSPSQISLALTCKRLSGLVSTVDLALSTTSAQYAGFLPRTVFDVPFLMAALKSWSWIRSPSDQARLRLCNHCLTFRPGYCARSDDEGVGLKGYWDTVEGCEISNFWIQKTGWVFGQGRWNKVVHDVSLFLPEAKDQTSNVIDLSNVSWKLLTLRLCGLRWMPSIGQTGRCRLDASRRQLETTIGR